MINKANLDNQIKIVVNWNNFQFELDEIQALEYFAMFLNLKADYDYLQTINNTNNVNIIKKVNGDKFNFNICENLIKIESELVKCNLTLNEFNSIIDTILNFLNEEYCKGIIDVETIDLKYLSNMLAVDLPFLTSSELVEVRLDDLRCFEEYNPKGLRIEESRYYKEIKDNKFNDDKPHKLNKFGQLNSERINDLTMSVKDNGYPINDNYIILYNNEMIIRDGERRAVILYNLFGGSHLVKVLRLNFSFNYKSFGLYHKANRS